MELHIYIQNETCTFLHIAACTGLKMPVYLTYTKQTANKLHRKWHVFDVTYTITVDTFIVLFLHISTNRIFKVNYTLQVQVYLEGHMLKLIGIIKKPCS
jgi:hypothetical protein